MSSSLGFFSYFVFNSAVYNLPYLINCSCHLTLHSLTATTAPFGNTRIRHTYQLYIYYYSFMDFLCRYGHLPFAVWVKILEIFDNVIIFSRIANLSIYFMLKTVQQTRIVLVTSFKIQGLSTWRLRNLIAYISPAKTCRNSNITKNALALIKVSSQYIIAAEWQRGRPRRADVDPVPVPAALMPSARTWPC